MLTAIRHAPAIPVRFEAALLLVGAVTTTGVMALVDQLGQATVAAAGLANVTDRNWMLLFVSPAAVLLLIAITVIVTAATLLFFATVLTVADLQLSGEPATLRLLGHRVALALRRSLRIELVLLAVLLLALAPFGGFDVFSPITASFGLPPFIEREFMKTPLSAVGWDAACVVLLYLNFRLVLTFPFTVVGGHRPARSFLRSLRATGPSAFGLGVMFAAFVGASQLLSVAHDELISRAADGTVASVFPSSLITVGTALVTLLVTVGAAQVLALVLTARVRAVSGLPIVPAPRRRATRAHRLRPLVIRFGLAAALVAVGTSAAPPPLPVANTSSDAIVIAHRGYDSGGVENTIGGLDAAVPFSPDYVEVDIQQTADGGFVASHDSNLLLTAGLDENIYEMSTAEVTSTVVTEKGHSDTIPTMAEYAARAKELGMPLLIEFKVTGHEKPGFVASALAELQQVGPLSDNIYHSLDPDVVEEINHTHPSLSVGLTIAFLTGAVPNVDCDFYVLEQASVTPDFIRAAHALGRPVYAWTVNRAAAMHTLLEWGVDGIVTDHPDMATTEEDSPGTSG